MILLMIMSISRCTPTYGTFIVLIEAAPFGNDIIRLAVIDRVGMEATEGVTSLILLYYLAFASPSQLVCCGALVLLGYTTNEQNPMVDVRIEKQNQIKSIANKQQLMN